MTLHHSGKSDFDSYKVAMERLERGTPPSEDTGFLGANLNPAEARIVLIPSPWDVTTSYRPGTSRGPEAIIAASHQLDLDDGSFGKVYRAGIAFLPHPDDIDRLNTALRVRAEKVMADLGDGKADKGDLSAVNEGSAILNRHVRGAAEKILAREGFPAVVGGDHASPLGLIEALSEKHKDGFGILHFDAHHDLREAYEGFTFSHASIFYNVMERVSGISKLVQVGIRDFCAEERDYMTALGKRGDVFYQRDLFKRKARGESWHSVCEDIISRLPAKVYISFDIDGLDPACCPSTGTPVPGGLGFDEAVYLLELLVDSGKKVIGFDLCEVSPDPEGISEWDANVGCRMLYKLCGALAKTQNIV
jgi:agmatinase